MHPMKRKAGQDEDSSRKAARTSEATTPPGFADQSPTPTGLTPIERITGRVQLSIKPLEQFIDRHNRIGRFIPPNRANHKHVHEAQMRIAEARDRIATSFNQLLGSLDYELSGMKRVARSMQWHALAGTNWYRNENLLNLEVDQLKELFEIYRIEDAEDFAEYLFGILRDERSDFGNSRIPLLRKALSDSTDDRVGYHEFHFESAMIFELSSEYARKGVSSARFGLAEEMRDSMYSKIRAPQAQWLDCAAARRRIWQVYEMMLPCSGPRDTDYESIPYYINLDKAGLCWHQIEMRFLEALHKAAHREIRSNVMLAVNERLPQELADLVLEAALISEGMPLETSIWKPNSDPSKEPTSLFEQYQCGRDLYWQDPDL